MTILAQKGGDFLNIQKGKVTYIHSSPKFAKITVTGTQNKIYVSPKLVNKHNLRVNNLVEFKSKTYDNGPSVTEFTKVRGSNVVSTTPKTQKSKNETRSKSKRGKQKARSKKKGIIGSTLTKSRTDIVARRVSCDAYFLLRWGGLNPIIQHWNQGQKV